jgi:lambda repressor-like predicted transcriptional regulator
VSSDFSGSEGAKASDVDLFGAPVSQIRERWGRPCFAKSKENQELVALLVTAGWSQTRIARHLGCDEKTLRKHFSRELERGADMIEAMALQVSLQKMRQGNGQAIGRILDLVDKVNLALPGGSRPTQQKPAEKKPEPLGKKAQAAADAQTAHQGTSWGETLQ